MYAKHFIITLALLMATLGAQGKNSQVQKLYIFGMAASFTDTIVHFTSIQEVDSAWTDKKKHFLLGREEYSYQLRDYLGAELLMPHRTCVVIYDTKRKKIEKRFAKMMRLYGSPAKNARQYDVRHIDTQDFRFRSMNMSAAIEQEQEEEIQMKATKQGRKGKKKKNAGQPGAASEGRRAQSGE